MTFFDDKAYTINDLIAAVEAIETELGIVPAGVYANVRARLDILESRINNPLAPAPDILNPFFIGNTGVTIQAGFGNPNTVLAVPSPPGSLYLREDGYNIQGLYSARTDGYWHQIDTDPWTAAGDLSGTIYTQTVVGLQGKPLPVPSGIGTALTWSGTVLGWTTIGGGGSPTGPATGDLGGSYPNPSVLKINGTSVPATPSANQALVATSGTSAIWKIIPRPGARVIWVDSNGKGDYTTISAALTAIGVPTSTADADEEIVVIVAPGVYTENLTIPAYRNITINGTVSNILVTGNVSWTNSAGGGAVAPTSAASLSLSNLAISGNVTCTDDSSVFSTLQILQDLENSSEQQIAVGGNIDCSGAARLTQIALSNVQTFGNLLANSSASISAINCNLDTNDGDTVTCFSLNCFNCTLRFNTFNCYGSFDMTIFDGTPTFTLTVQRTFWDAYSLFNFFEAGGSNATMKIIVRGGFKSTSVSNATTTVSGTTSISMDGGGATAGFTFGGNDYSIVTLTGNQTLVLLTGHSAQIGDTLRVNRSSIAANTLTIRNAASGGTILFTMPVSIASWAIFRFTGSAWVLDSSNADTSGGGSGNIYTVHSTITATTYLVVSADQFIPVDSTSNTVTLTLPASPATGEWHIIADISGSAPTFNIIINGNGKNIVGSSTFTITNAFNSIQVAYNGTNWSII